MRASRIHHFVWVWLVAGCVAAHAQVTNVVLQMTINGTLGIQNTGPKLQQASFNSANFADIVGVTPLSSDVVLALNFDFLATSTNMYLTVYNKATREQLQRITTSEDTVWFSDGENLIFSLHAPLPVRLLVFAGGVLEIAGSGKFNNGVPSEVTAGVRGILVDARPLDGGGTTGLVLRATLKTGAQLRVSPAAP